MILKKCKKLLLLAETIAKKAHEGQFRDDNKTPYITHPKAVVEEFTYRGRCTANINVKERVIAWLHGVIEDTTVTFADLLNQGIPFEHVSVINVLTKKDCESYLEYILRVKRDVTATKIKLADLTHNAATSKEHHQKEKYELAKYILERI